MKIIVIYQTKTGFTKQYASWIAETLHCDCLALDQISHHDIENCDYVVFGGWIMGNVITGLEQLLKFKPKHLILFGVGATPSHIIDINIIKETNHITDIPFFYMEGGMNFHKLPFVMRIMLKMMKKSLIKKEMKTPQEQFMVDILGTSFDHSHIENIKPLIDYIK